MECLGPEAGSICDFGWGGWGGLPEITGAKLEGYEGTRPEKRQFQTENNLCEAWGLMPLEGQKGGEHGYDRESEGDWTAQGSEWHLELHWRRHATLLNK